MQYYYSEDSRHPIPIRALVRHDLPNLRRAFSLLLQRGEIDVATVMADRTIRFMQYMGLERERDEWRRQLAEATRHRQLLQREASGSKGVRSDALTEAEFLVAYGIGEDAYDRGDLLVAVDRFTSLLARIEAGASGTARGYGSYQHAATLGQLARCMRDSGQSAAAETITRQALTMIGMLIGQEPSNRFYLHLTGTLQVRLGNVLCDQGKYWQARTAYEEALKFTAQIGDQKSQAVALGQLGTLALVQGAHTEARERHQEALAFFESLGEPRMVATAWYQLGRVADVQRQWNEARRCYRQSLEIETMLGNLVGVALTCNQLAIVAVNDKQPDEAEDWYKRALALIAQVQPDGLSFAQTLSNLADLLVTEVKAGRAAQERLDEARGYAEQVQHILDKLDSSSEPWKSLHILSDIATQQGRSEAARTYRRRERETYRDC